MKKKEKLLYVYINDNEISYTKEVRGSWGSVMVDYDEDSNIVGIEVLSFKKIEIDGESIDKK